MPSKPRVSYYYDEQVGCYNFGYGHPMKPFRMRMAHSLITAYELDKYMEVLRPTPATTNEMTKFHSNDYIEYIKRASPEFAEKQHLHTLRYLPGDDCPPFDGIFEFCSISAGGSIAAAHRINHGQSDIVVNWSGGLHHAKKSEASGFCYINDIVLAILELLRYHQRVLYLDIDVHHGDGVEEAFYSTDRVMTVSFHKFGDFFPGTGDIRDVGIGKGKNYSINVPLRDGIDDESYKSIFQPIMRQVMATFRPGAVVMQCGTDSLSGDRLGCFNLSMNGHADCVRFMKGFGVPLLCLGGGGYTVRNVSRTWAYETSVLLDKDISPILPYNDYYEFYGPEYILDVPNSNMENLNTPDYLEQILVSIFEYLRSVQHAPSVQLESIPKDWPGYDSDADAEMLDKDQDENMESRLTQLQEDRSTSLADEMDIDRDSDANDDGSDNNYLLTTSSGRAVRVPHSQSQPQSQPQPQASRNRRQARTTKQKPSRQNKQVPRSSRTAKQKLSATGSPSNTQNLTPNGTKKDNKLDAKKEPKNEPKELPEANAEADTNVDAGAEADAEADAEAEADVDADANVSANADAELEAELEAEMDAAIETEGQSIAEAVTEAVAMTVAETVVESIARTETEPTIKTVTETVVQSVAGTRKGDGIAIVCSDIKVGGSVELKPQPDVQIQTDHEVSPESKEGINAEAISESGNKPNFQTKTEQTEKMKGDIAPKPDLNTNQAGTPVTVEASDQVMGTIVESATKTLDESGAALSAKKIQNIQNIQNDGNGKNDKISEKDQKMKKDEMDRSEKLETGVTMAEKVEGEDVGKDKTMSEVKAADHTAKLSESETAHVEEEITATTVDVLAHRVDENKNISKNEPEPYLTIPGTIPSPQPEIKAASETFDADKQLDLKSCAKNKERETNDSSTQDKITIEPVNTEVEPITNSNRGINLNSNSNDQPLEVLNADESQTNQVRETGEISIVASTKGSTPTNADLVDVEMRSVGKPSGQ